MFQSLHPVIKRVVIGGGILSMVLYTTRPIPQLTIQGYYEGAISKRKATIQLINNGVSSMYVHDVFASLPPCVSESIVTPLFDEKQCFKVDNISKVNLFEVKPTANAKLTWIESVIDTLDTNVTIRYSRFSLYPFSVLTTKQIVIHVDRKTIPFCSVAHSSPTEFTH